MRLRKLSNGDLDVMIEAVAVRYRVKCDELNCIIIRQTLQSEYLNYKVEDFNKAFIKHCAGAFTISDKSDNNKPYGDLSTLFVCQVLNSYKDHLNKINARPKVIDVSKQIPAPKIDQKLENRRQYEFILNEYNKTGKMPFPANWKEAFNYLEENKLIEISNDEKEMFAENIKAQLQSELSFLRKNRKNYNHISLILKSKSAFKNECRKRYVKLYIENDNEKEVEA